MSYPKDNKLSSYRRTEDDYEMSAKQGAGDGFGYDVKFRGYKPPPENGAVLYTDQKPPPYDSEAYVPPEQVTLLTPRDRGIRILADSSDEGSPRDNALLPRDGKHLTGAPSDRFHMVYMIMLIHGIGVLLPWNAFINAEGYFICHKFGFVQCENGEDVNDRYRGDFFPQMTNVAQSCSLLFCLANLFFRFGGSLTTRIVISIGFVVAVVLETFVLALMDTRSWTNTFRIITLISVGIMNVFNGIYQNSLYGLAASLPSKFTNAVIIGNNVSGTFVSLLAIAMALIFGDDLQSSGIYYFLVALLVLLVAFVTYFVLPFLKFYRFYTVQPAVPISITVQPELQQKTSFRHAARSFGNHCMELWTVFKQVYFQCWNVFFTFFVTLVVFPLILLHIKTVGDIWTLAGSDAADAFNSTVCKSDLLKTCAKNQGPNWFILVGIFLTFNFSAFIGNLIPGICTKPGPRFVWIPVLLRVVFIPFFLYCNYATFSRPRTTPVFFASDYYFLIGNILLGISSGYLSSLTMMFAPGAVKDPRLAPIAGQIAAFFLVFGIFSGLWFSWLINIACEKWL